MRRIPAVLGMAAMLLGSVFTATAAAQRSDVGAQATVEYLIRVTTTDVQDAGTDSAVEIRLNGTLGSTGFMLLNQGPGDFERRQVDSFSRLVADVGTMRSVDVKYTRGGGSPAWHLSHITITAPGKPVVQVPAHRWFTDGVEYVNLPVAANARVYTIQVHTSDVVNAGTDGSVEVQLHGSAGSSVYFHLDQYGVNNFEQGSTESFQRVIDSVGPLESIDVRWDPAGDSPHWHLAEVTVVVSPGGGRVEETAVFPCHCWFAAFSTVEFNLPVA